jgi:hypothetical protein
MDLRKIRFGGMYWIHTAECRDQWPVVLYIIMNLRVPKECGEFFD